MTGFSLDTLRYYERLGLLDGVARTAGGRRVFGDEHVAWLGLLRCLRDTGMPIARVQQFARLSRQPGTEAQRLALLEEHDADVARRVADLLDKREQIRAKIAWYRGEAASPLSADPVDTERVAGA